MKISASSLALCLLMTLLTLTHIVQAQIEVHNMGMIIGIEEGAEMSIEGDYYDHTAVQVDGTINTLDAPIFLSGTLRITVIFITMLV